MKYPGIIDCKQLGRNCAPILMAAILTGCADVELPEDPTPRISMEMTFEDYVPRYTVKVETGYLALRTKKEFNSKNEIGKLYTGDTVIECPTSGDESVYRYVYAPSLGKHGYVNGSYLRYKGEYDGEVMYAKVKTGYLAVRKAKAFESKNEIGKLYTGDPVVVLDRSDSEYWTVYAPTISKTGYVNCSYLYEQPTKRKVNTTEVPMDFPANSYADWNWTSDSSDFLNVRMQFLNTSSDQTIESFEVYVYAKDSSKNRIYGDTVYTWVTNKIVEPGQVVYCDYMTIPKRKQIRYIYAGVKSVTLTDGTVCERPYLDWDDDFGEWVVR